MRYAFFCSCKSTGSHTACCFFIITYEHHHSSFVPILSTGRCKKKVFFLSLLCMNRRYRNVTRCNTRQPSNYLASHITRKKTNTIMCRRLTNRHCYNRQLHYYQRLSFVGFWKKSINFTEASWSFLLQFVYTIHRVALLLT